MLPFPVIGEQDLARLVHINDNGNMPGFAAHVVDGRFDPAGGGDGLRTRLADLRRGGDQAIFEDYGARLIVLSDRESSSAAQPAGADPVAAAYRRGAPPPSREKTRTRVRLIVESGDARECHHIALLNGYGAAAVCPYLAIETVRDLAAGASTASPAAPVPPRSRRSPRTRRSGT